MNIRKTSRITAVPAAQMDWLKDLPAQSLNVAQTLQWLNLWTGQGLLRHIDSALAAQLLRLDASASPALLVAAAMLAQMEGRGHTCLSVLALTTPPVDMLGWSTDQVQAPQGLQALWVHLPGDVAGWVSALQSAPGACLRRADAPDLGQPLVLGGSTDAPLLYLRRYRAYEERVGHQLLQRAQSFLPVPEALARQWLDRFFGHPAQTALAPKQGSADEDQTDWQKLACAVALRAQMAVITGGPGTGKTQVLAARIGNILLNTDARPQNILCLTFSNAGVNSMKKKLRGLMGSAADQVKVSTFHSFAHDIIIDSNAK